MERHPQRQPGRRACALTRRQGFGLLLCCLAAGAGLSEWLGQDGNYDLQGYHLQNGAALLNGRFYQDLLPAGLQSYLNPVLDALYAGLALGPLRRLPRILAAAMGLWYGAALFLAAQAARVLYPGQWLAAPASLLAVTGVAMVSQVGTSFNEVQAAAIMLGGLLLLLRRAGGGQAGFGQAASWSGALFGVAAGLKLTASAYAPAAALAACWGLPPRRAGRAGLLFACGWLAGFALSDGWWALMLWRRFGNPVFPLFNGVFHSPWYPPASFIDSRFLPHGLLRALAYPVLWLASPTPLVSEVPLRDPRGAVVLCLGLAVAVSALVRKQPRLLPAQRAMLVFLVAGYAVWVSTSGILRYAVVLEASAGLVTPLLVVRLLPRRAAQGAVAAVTAAMLAATQYGSWGRVPYGAQTLRADTDWVQPGTLVIPTLRYPLSNMAPLMPHQHSISVLGLDFALLDARGWRLHDEAVRRVREHDGPIVVLTGGDPAAPAYELGEIGLDPVMTGCRPVGSSFITPNARGPFACDAHRRALPVLPSPFWRQAAARYRTLADPHDAAWPLFGATYLLAAGAAARGTRIIDWTDLLWNGVGPRRNALPDRLDPGTLYVLASGAAADGAAKADPAHDGFGQVDGVLVLAPGWRDCAACTASPQPLP